MGRRPLLSQGISGGIHTEVADVDAGTGNEMLDLRLAPVAEVAGKSHKSFAAACSLHPGFYLAA